jgi:hypothetical protein
MLETLAQQKLMACRRHVDPAPPAEAEGFAEVPPEGSGAESDRKSRHGFLKPKTVEFLTLRNVETKSVLYVGPPIRALLVPRLYRLPTFHLGFCPSLG